MLEICRVDCIIKYRAFTGSDNLKVITLYQYFMFNWNLVTVELQWLEQLWNHENMFETGVIRANEC